MSETPPEQPAAPSVGPLAMEAALLLDVVADRLESMKQTASAGAQPSSGDTSAAQGTTPTPDPAAGTPGTGARASADGRCPECGSVPGAACTACPLCRFMALMRGERPEATARLVDGALMIIRTLRSMVPDPPEQASSTSASPTPTPPTAPAAHPHPRRGGLEHIDIS